ncbi:MAG: hypothetical protein M1834_003251 [Cirrosporium novae-zelandiae]|nr:MAG: hypothetical protein M1834_003251 [Cirrosporium novae-zelandiae]
MANILSALTTESYSQLQVVKTPSEAPGHYDYIVCAHKAIDQETVAKQFSPVVDEKGTTFVLIQNGVGNEEPFRKIFPGSTIISCVTWVGGVQNTPGIVNHTKNENTQLGLYPNPGLDTDLEKRRLDIFASLLREGGTKLTVESNIQVQRWEKVVWNCAWNSLTTLTMLDTQSWLNSSPEAMIMTRRLMREVIDVGRKCGVPLEFELVDILMDRILAMPGIRSSMQEDCANGRPMEVDMIMGTPVRKARELKMDTPTLETIYAILLGVDFRLRNARL